MFSVAFPGLSTRTDFTAAAQNPPPQLKVAATEGSISGTVTGPSGAIVSGVRVTLLTDGTGSRQTVMTAVTDPKGSFMFEAVAPGTYTIEVESAGVVKATRSRLVVERLEHLVVDFSLATESPSVRITAKPGAPAGTVQGLSSLGGFNYYDTAELKPSSVNVSLDPGGYSAAQQVDSYGLMLDYLEAEHAAAPRDNGQPHSQGAAGARAVSQLPTAPELDGWNESQFLSRGSDLLLHHDTGASTEIFQAGVAHFPNSAKLQTGLGIALSARGEYEKAIACLLRATDLTPSDPGPYFVLAKAYSSSCVPSDEILRRLKRLVTLDPSNPQARYYYALALAKGSINDPTVLKQVESLLQSALAIDPNFADAHLQLGILYAALSDYPGAIREYQSALRLKPSLAAAHYRLAQAYARTGEKTAAQVELESYERLRKQAPASPR